MREDWFVYILRCADGTLYTGIARDVDKRIKAHAEGRGARYTRGRGPFVLQAKTRCRSHGDALRIELAVKALDRAAKRRMVSAYHLAAFARRARSS